MPQQQNSNNNNNNNNNRELIERFRKLKALCNLNKNGPVPSCSFSGEDLSPLCCLLLCAVSGYLQCSVVVFRRCCSSQALRAQTARWHTLEIFLRSSSSSSSSSSSIYTRTREESPLGSRRFTRTTTTTTTTTKDVSK